ncbi:hypothetical protein C8R45DRAFT_956126 [Mycena sanguinolenta]|nr:hypothetical protein C8R45DRAFT_956126 [Mycena sanguinolenta]
MSMTSHLRRRLAELDAQIAEHRRVLQELEDARTAVERELNATVYPVLSLPPEIMAEIFIHCLPPFVNLGWWYEYGIVAPILFTRVCHAWRDIALATPVLWSTLTIIFPHGPLSQRLSSDFIYRWLARAGQCPLSIVFRDDGTGSEIALLTNVIQRYSPQIRYLELHTTKRQVHKLGLDVDFPLLESAFLRSEYDSHDVDDELVLLSNAPRLTEFYLDPVVPDDITRPVTLPWSQLTKYHGIMQSFRFFDKLPNLTEATCFLKFPLGSSLTGVTHPRLSSLTVNDPGVGDILANLTLPALQHLDISAKDEYQDLEAFLLRSSPPLVSLSTRGTDNDCDWSRCLAPVAKTLQTLFFNSPSADFLATIFPDQDSSPLSRSSLPNLRALSLEPVVRDCKLGYHGLIRFLYSRSSRFDHLRSFRLVWDSSPFLDDDCWAGQGDTGKWDKISNHLSVLMSTGLDIYLGIEEKNYAVLQ